jgi:hypothetical protein
MTSRKDRQQMKKRIVTVIAAAAALVTLTATSAAAGPSGGVLVRQGDGYRITGAFRTADSGVLTVHGTLTELTTGFTSCPLAGTASFGCLFIPNTCNLLGGEVTLNFQGTIYDAFVSSDALGHAESVLCQDPDNPTTYSLTMFAWSTSHVPPGQFPDIFNLGGTVQQITPKLFKWSS